MSTAMFSAINDTTVLDTRPGFDVIRTLEGMADYEASEGRGEAAAVLYRAAGSLYEQYGDWMLACQARHKANPSYAG